MTDVIVTVGLIISAGRGAQEITMPPPEDFAPLQVDVRLFTWDDPKPIDCEEIIDEALRMRDAGVERIALIGSSKGVPVAQLAVAACPDLFNGGYLAVSGAGGPHWGLEAFPDSVRTPVLQMRGGRERGRFAGLMSIIDRRIASAGGAAKLRVYAGEKHGFINRSRAAQTHLVTFFEWALFGAEVPGWWGEGYGREDRPRAAALEAGGDGAGDGKTV